MTEKEMSYEQLVYANALVRLHTMGTCLNADRYARGLE